ncbi:CRISPR-associated endonuclease Cas6 [Fusobacterium animalis]|uniref:CRISPR-associated endonuclease Cas6 n=1 Tax=Fusobacterium animalis TaxID=76859 RepID=UPI0030D2041A
MKLVEVIFKGEDKFSKSSAKALRGYFGNYFKNIVEFHNHLDQITFNYKSPNIQYRVIKGNLSILGINKGGDILLKSMEEIKLDEIILDGIDNKIKEKEIKITFPELEIKDERYGYKFESFWIALNEENYKKYKKGELSLDIQLRNNILEFFKLCGTQAEKRIIAAGEFEENKIIEKDTVILGFTGTFKTNVNLPNFISLGKRKSIGFGIIKRIKYEDYTDKN